MPPAHQPRRCWPVDRQPAIVKASPARPCAPAPEARDQWGPGPRGPGQQPSIERLADPTGGGRCRAVCPVPIARCTGRRWAREARLGLGANALAALTLVAKPAGDPSRHHRQARSGGQRLRARFNHTWGRFGIGTLPSVRYRESADALLRGSLSCPRQIADQLWHRYRLGMGPLEGQAPAAAPGRALRRLRIGCLEAHLS